MNKTSTKEILEQFKNTKSIEDIYIPKGLRKEHYLEIENGTPVLKKKHSKILTAQEVLDSNLGFDEFNQPIWTNKSVKRAMIEFAKQHIESALKAAAESAKITTEYYHEDDVGITKVREILNNADIVSERTDGDGILYAVDTYYINKKSILNAYDKSLII